jgi:hypothetical protein
MSELLHEVPHELGNIGRSVAERRQRDRESIQPIVEVFAEFPVSDQQRQIPIGRGNDTHIDSRGARAAYWFELTLLEHAEQLRLKFQRHVSDLVKKQRSTIRQREAADMRIDGARKGSAFVSEELAFEKPGWHRRAVHLDQISVSTGTELVNRARDDFLASAGFAGDQNSGVRGRYRLHFSEHWAQAAVAANDRLEERWPRAFWLTEDWFIRTI